MNIELIDLAAGTTEVRPMETHEVVAAVVDVKAALLAAVDRRLDDAAKLKGYDSIGKAALRAALPDSPFHAEGVAYGTWMDDTYATCYALLAEVEAGTRSIPTEAELMALLPPPPDL